MKTLRRGLVALVRLDPAQGREIRKTRPAVVVSNDAACRFDAVIQVVPLTGLADREPRPYESLVESTESGVDKASRAVANQVRTIARERITRHLGSINDEEQEALDRALHIQLGL
ncbi:MAG: type II toxin-antitoxin system PemK/MazF family toxin [Thermoanaerobaculia bacterium]